MKRNAWIRGRARGARGKEAEPEKDAGKATARRIDGRANVRKDRSFRARRLARRKKEQKLGGVEEGRRRQRISKGEKEEEDKEIRQGTREYIDLLSAAIPVPSIIFIVRCSSCVARLALAQTPPALS